MNLKIIAVVGFFASILLLWFILQTPAEVVHITVGETTVLAEIVDSIEERQRGLSGRDSLPENHGMLFEFEREGSWGIWMKDMHFAIDILWADEQGRIVTIEHSVVPETYPNVFYPTVSARYVLELPAGFANTHALEEGMQIVL